ncbi:hypothetical protein ROHU_009444 [Labeo rohita]|uniref:Transposase domain-containing protein n=1 Tax=Labeo rohita TaxID=84645 RepID=A0A498LZ28_LABRO|nr:hypothetical protein ROHU_009444 [Labeo rohita]
MLNVVEQHLNDDLQEQYDSESQQKPSLICKIKCYGGKYTYFGLKEGLTHTLSERDTSKYDYFEISLNIDGLPIFKSKNLTMWPLQCAVINIDEVKNSPFVVALYSGAKKPDDLEFLRGFMEELQELMETGFKGKRTVLKNIICDAPARALIKGIVQFNGRYGCDFCDYRICLFGDGQTSVVPISWIFDDNGTLKCRWTSSLSNIKNNSPPNPNWKVYDIVKIVGPSIGDYDQANQYISDYTTGVSAAEDSITYSVTDPAVVELPEKRKRKNKLCDESDINSETSSCEDTLQRSGKKDEDDPKPTSSDVSGDYDQANQYISDYTTGVSAAEDSITYSVTDPAVVELPEKRKRKNKLCDESDINSETSSCEDTLQRSGKKDEDDPKPTSSDVSEFHDLQQHHMTYKEIPVQTRTPDDVHLKKSRNAMKRVGLKTKNVQLAKTPRYHDTLQGNVAMHEDDHPKSSASSGKEPKETKCKVTMEKLFAIFSFTRDAADREVGFIKENTENLNCYAVLTWRLLLTGKQLKCCDDDTSQEPLLAKLVQP